MLNLQAEKHRINPQAEKHRGHAVPLLLQLVLLLNEQKAVNRLVEPRAPSRAEPCLVQPRRAGKKGHTAHQDGGRRQ